MGISSGVDGEEYDKYEGSMEGVGCLYIVEDELWGRGMGVSMQ